MSKHIKPSRFMRQKRRELKEILDRIYATNTVGDYYHSHLFRVVGVIFPDYYFFVLAGDEGHPNFLGREEEEYKNVSYAFSLFTPTGYVFDCNVRMGYDWNGPVGESVSFWFIKRQESQP